MTTDSAEHRSSDDVTEVTETWAAEEPLEHRSSDAPDREAGLWKADPGPDAPEPETAKALDDAAVASELEALSRVRSDPWRLQHLMGLIAAIAVGLWLGMTLRWLLLFVIIASSFAMVVGLGFIVARLRIARQDALLRILAIAAERGMPLSTGVAAFADQFRGKSRQRALNLIARLNTGSLLPEALEQTSKAVSRDAVLMAWVGQVTGMLPQALRLAGVFRAGQLALWMATASRLTYLLGMIVILQVLVGGLSYFIMPRFGSIFQDFGVRLPEITNFVIRISREYAPVSILSVIPQVVLLLYIPFSFGGWMNYNVPIFDRLLTRRHTALILRALSLVIESNKPIALGLSTVASHYPTKWVRRRLRRVEADVRLGSDWIDALWRAGLLRRSDAEVLGSAASVGNLAWALRELAETSERRQNLRIQTVLQTLFPLVVVVIGLAVAVLALAYFLPIVLLIQEITDL